MRIFFTLFILTCCSVAQAQEPNINFKYRDYQIEASGSFLLVTDLKQNLKDTVFIDFSEDYYLTSEGIKRSSEQVLKLKTTHPKKYEDLLATSQLFQSYENFKILSIVGPCLSYSLEYYYDGGAHPSYGTQFITYNIETKEKCSLSDFFSDEELYLALIKNEFILNYIDPEKISNLEELKGEFYMNVDSQYDLDFSAFSFNHIIDNKVIINMGLSHGSEVHRGSFEMISITLSIPKELDKFLKKSATKGLLAQDL